MKSKKDTAAVTERRHRYICRKCGNRTSGFTGTVRVSSKLCRKCFGKRKDRRHRELNDLTGAEWAKLSLSVQQYPDVRSKKQRLHGACFPISLVKQFVSKYTKKGDNVFDPFAGVGTTHDACIELARNCIGIDINARFTKLARSSFPKRTKRKYKIYTRDATHMAKIIARESIDFIITSPPYASLLKNVKDAFAYKWKEHSKIASKNNPKPYTNLQADLGNMDVNVFFKSLAKIMLELSRVLKRDKYMVWVVKDYRDTKAGKPYINFHGDIIKCAEDSGFTLWDIVIYDQTKFRPLVCLGYPSKKYYHNIGHSYIIIFRKGSLR